MFSHNFVFTVQKGEYSHQQFRKRKKVVILSASNDSINLVLLVNISLYVLSYEKKYVFFSCDSNFRIFFLEQNFFMNGYDDKVEESFCYVRILDRTNYKGKKEEKCWVWPVISTVGTSTTRTSTPIISTPITSTTRTSTPRSPTLLIAAAVGSR